MIEDHLKTKKWSVEKTSSKLNINVQESFEKLIKKTLEVKYGIEEQDTTPKNDLLSFFKFEDKI